VDGNDICIVGTAPHFKKNDVYGGSDGAVHFFFLLKLRQASEENCIISSLLKPRCSLFAGLFRSFSHFFFKGLSDLLNILAIFSNLFFKGLFANCFHFCNNVRNLSYLLITKRSVFFCFLLEFGASVALFCNFCICLLNFYQFRFCLPNLFELSVR